MFATECKDPALLLKAIKYYYGGSDGSVIIDFEEVVPILQQKPGAVGELCDYLRQNQKEPESGSGISWGWEFKLKLCAFVVGEGISEMCC